MGLRDALAAPFRLEPQDSGSAAAPVRYVAAPGARPVFSGGAGLEVRAAAPGVGREGQGQNEAANGKEELNAQMPVGENKDAFRSGQVGTSLKQAAQQMKEEYRRDGDETQAVDLADQLRVRSLRPDPASSRHGR